MTWQDNKETNGSVVLKGLSAEGRQFREHRNYFN